MVGGVQYKSVSSRVASFPDLSNRFGAYSLIIPKRSDGPNYENKTQFAIIETLLFNSVPVMVLLWL